MMEVLEDVVSYGTATNGYVPGYRVAGKTGTSETIQTDTTGRYIVSFCGIAPADNPAIVVFVMLDHPTNGDPSGGRMAAPATAKIIEEVLEYMQVERRYTEKDKQNMLIQKAVPNLVGKTISEARQIVIDAGLNIKISGEDDSDNAMIYEQMPASGTSVPETSMVVVYTAPDPVKKQVVVPDLTGFTLEHAYQLLLEMGLNMKATNTGNVVSQSIPPGTSVDPGSIVELELVTYDVE
jgi:stage V sporulation protein D (sporulation-specific penicillin-binding protein)